MSIQTQKQNKPSKLKFHVTNIMLTDIAPTILLKRRTNYSKLAMGSDVTVNSDTLMTARKKLVLREIIYGINSNIQKFFT